MKKVILSFSILTTTVLCFGQNTVSSSGGDIYGTGNISYSLGQLTTNTYSGNGIALQGVQIASEEFILEVDDILSISTLAIVYPNPTAENTKLKISSVEENVNYTLFNNLGNEILGDEVNTIITTIPTSELATGVYFLKVTDNTNASKTFKLIKK